MRPFCRALVTAALATLAACSSSSAPDGGVPDSGTPDSGTPDSGSPPTVVATSPANGATGVARTTGLTVTFSEAMDCSTLTSSALGESLGGTSIAGTIGCSGTQATFTPSASLSPDATYVAAVQAGVRDVSGHALAATFSWSYTTAPATGGSCDAGTDGSIYVADFGNSRVVRTDDMCGTNWTTFSAVNGSAVDLLDGAQDVFVDTTGEIYIADTFNNRIVRMDDMTGTNFTTLGGPTPGTGVNEFTTPRSIFVANGHIYVTDGFSTARIVQMDDMTGKNWTTYPPPPPMPNPFGNVWGLFVDSTGHIYATDVANRGPSETVARVVRMDDISGTGFVAYGSTPGSGAGQFANPWGVAVDSTHHIYIADGSNQRIVRMDDMSGTNWTTLGTPGVYTGPFFFPQGIFVAASGRIYVADFGASASYGAYNRIVRIDDMTGTNFTTLGTMGNGLKQFSGPLSIWVR